MINLYGGGYYFYGAYVYLMDKGNNDNSSKKKLEVLLDLETEALFLHEKIEEFISENLAPIDFPNDES